MSMWRIKEQNRHREEFWKDSTLTQWMVPSERPLLVKMEIPARTFSKLLQKQSVVKKRVSYANCFILFWPRDFSPLRAAAVLEKDVIKDLKLVTSDGQVELIIYVHK